MIITSSNVKTASYGSYEKTMASSTKLVGINSNSQIQLGISSLSVRKYDYLELSAEYMRNGKNAQSKLSGDSGETGEPEENIAQNGEDSAAQQKIDAPSPERLQPGNMPRMYSVMEMKMELLRQMVAALKGERYYSGLLSGRPSESSGMSFSLLGGQQLRTIQTVQTQIFSIVREEKVSESQSVSYSANGVVNTADGKTIDFYVNMNMSRSTEFVLQQKLGVSQVTSVVKSVDPLIINYAGTAASLTGEKFDFDLDLDGQLDKISFAGEGSGFLALDKNGDGEINDGNELFGPQNGDGFAELRKYDLDGNGWIDEADEIYSQLRIWSKDKDGNDILFTLKDLDVGAIYLNENKTEFDIRDDSDNVQGYMQSTSFFLKDSGGAGTISHIDLLA